MTTTSTSSFERDLLRMLVENVPVGIVLTRAPGLIVEIANPMAKAVTPFALEVGKSVFTHAPPETVGTLEAEQYGVLNVGKPYRAADRLIRRRLEDGSYEERYYSFTSVRVTLPDGTFGVLSVGQETTETRKAYAFVSTVLENIPDMVFVKEAKELRFTRFNKAGEELLGHSREELIGKNDYDFFPRSEADFFTSADRSVLESGKLLEIHEEPIHTRLKGKRVLHTKKVPIYNEQGKPEYLLGISEDITERKEAERNRERLLEERYARAESERALKLRDEFISIAAHELKTPLTALKMQVQLLEKVLPPTDSDGTQRVRWVVENAVEQVERFSRLIDDLLDVSRVTAGTLTIEKTKADLSEIVLRVIKRFGEELKKACCPVGLDLAPSLRGDWDPLRIEQVVINLLSNAMKYGRGKPISISTTGQAGVVRLDVTDHGIGIARADQERIFERFERAASTKAYGGLGLGLFIARQIVSAHGGSIRVRSDEGKGSTFTVELLR